MSFYNDIARKGRLTLGLVFPLEAYNGAVPAMQHQEKLARRAEALGFRALWFRDVPFHDPGFGDAGQLYDPWIYMTHMMHHTQSIALATGSLILPLRHPVHTVKAMNSLQLLSGGRLMLGVASGDRPVEYPAFNRDLDTRAELFRDNFFYIKALQQDFPNYTSQHYGATHGSIDLLPKYEGKTPMLVTGHSGQTINWIAKHADGWLYYPRDPRLQLHIVQQWQDAVSAAEMPWKPFMQSLYIDLMPHNDAPPSPIHLGLRTGADYLNEYLHHLQSLGVSHVILNLKYGRRPAGEVIEELGEKVVGMFG